jgi:peptidoglycan/xylan/chitin deacetylase (PgdA/CDA1 family)
VKTRVLITIDTEFLWQPERLAEGWEANLARGFDPAGVGVPYQLLVLARHGLKACFFVDPMPACLFGIEPIRRMVAPILEAGQEVQLHLHPQWSRARRDGSTTAAFELTAWDEARQRELIFRARDLLIEAGAPPPTAFRAGSYAANDDTLRALASLGMRYDSSHNGSHHPWPSALSLPSAQIAPVIHREVIEVPVTQIADGRGLRHLQLCAVSSAELAAALDHAAREKHASVTIVSHSFELASRSGLRANTTHVRRFEALCALLAARRNELPTAFFADLRDLPLGQPDRPLPHSPVRALARQASQLWSNAVGERA